MTEKERTKLSKKMTYVLRHRPEAAGLTLDPSGWVEVGVLADALEVDLDDVYDVVNNPGDKQRFTLSQEVTELAFIRAAQGHSTKVDLMLVQCVPPPSLYHGTHAGVLSQIFEQGIVKMGRSHVHLSHTVEKAADVGRRRGKPVILEVNALRAHHSGVKFYLADNGVWLADHVPASYLKAWLA